MNIWMKKSRALLITVVGFVMMLAALYQDFRGSEWTGRGALLIIGVLGILAGIYLFPTRKHRQIVYGLFLLPLLFSFLLTVLIPFVGGAFYSLTDWNGVTYKEFVGLENYISILTSSDFIYSFGITALFTVMNMILVNVGAFGLAMLCTSKIKRKNFYRAVYFLPNLIGGIVLGYIWQFIFSKVFVMIFGGNSMLADANLAMVAILIVEVWQYAGYIMMLYITGLQAIPQEIIEAADMDGASWGTMLFRIKIPMIWNTITVCVFLTLVNSFKLFDLNLALTNGAPSRVMGGKMYSATEFLAMNIYNTAITKGKYAQGQAKAVVFFVILAVVSLTQVVLSKKKEVEV